MSRIINRLVLKKLVFKGEGKEPAIIDFSLGLNVISGPSDTGKTLIFECIDYVLGGGSTLKTPSEADGYKDIFLTFQICPSGKFITLKRSFLKKGDVTLYNETYENIKKSKFEILAASSKGKKNLSDTLLKILGINNKKLKKNQDNETKNLTFNVLKKLFLINETRIIEKESPIYNGQRTDSTSEKSLLRFMITGIDSSDIIKQKAPKITMAEKKAKIELLESLIQKNTSQLKKLDTNIESIITDGSSKELELEEQLKKLDTNIESIITDGSSKELELKELKKKKKHCWEESIKLESEIDQFSELLNRFLLLSKYYKSDLKRLDATIEAGELLSYIPDSSCLICGAKSEFHKKNCAADNKDIENIKESCRSEKIKIESLREDLLKTVDNITVRKKEIEKEKKINSTEIQTLDNLISKNLNPYILNIKKDLAKKFEKKKTIELALNMFSQIRDFETLILDAKKEASSSSKAEKKFDGLRTSESSNFISIIEENLRKWNYPELSRVVFNEDNQDIVLNDKNRIEHGKGYRAITQAAFIISLMDFCVKNKQPHSGFVVLDSPIVTFRGKEKNNPDEFISDDMKDKFYKSLAKIKNDRQIIILENDDPPKGILNEINHIQFTKDKTSGRSGFIP